jgi:quercetin dioxygenase-like cupin family protein
MPCDSPLTRVSGRLRALDAYPAVHGPGLPGDTGRRRRVQEHSQVPHLLHTAHPSERDGLGGDGIPLAGTTSRVAGEEVGVEVKPVHVEQLLNVPGKTSTAVVVAYAPAGKSGAHQHAGSVFASVLSGAIRSENFATGPAKVYKAGESFFEPPGSQHLISENASATEPASLLVVFVADDGAQLTRFDQ